MFSFDVWIFIVMRDRLFFLLDCPYHIIVLVHMFNQKEKVLLSSLHTVEMTLIVLGTV